MLFQQMPGSNETSEVDALWKAAGWRRAIHAFGATERADMILKKIAFLSVLLFLLTAVSAQVSPKADVSAEVKAELVEYLRSHWQSPEDYVLSKFRDHDLVFLGEGHKFKHDVELVLNLIPLLYEIGVTDLGVEFGCSEQQDEADRLVTAETYDEGLARRIMFQWGPYWPYKEYLDIYRKAWELNRTLRPKAPTFRVVHLDYRANWPLVSENTPRGIWQKVFFRGDRDDFMASVVIEEFVKKKKKALIYAGAIHTLTRFREPNFDFGTGKARTPSVPRMGNIVYDRVGPRVFYIQLHFPWPLRAEKGRYGYPVDGAIDLVMRGFEDKRVGFDVAGTPFGRLGDKGSTFSARKDDFTLAVLCDGYVFQKSFGEYNGVTVDWEFITPENFHEALDYLPNPKLRKIYKNPRQFLADMEMKADFKLQFPDLK
jgi:hypothetical protein